MRIKYDDMEKLLAHSELNKRLVLITTRSQRADLKKKKKKKSALDFLSKYIICQNYVMYLMAKNLKRIF